MNLRTLAGVAVLAIVIIYLPVTAGNFVHSLATGFGSFIEHLFPKH